MFDSLCGTWYIPENIWNKIKDKSITHNIFRIQSDDSITCGFYCIIVGKSLSDYTNLFSPNDYQKRDKIIYKCHKGTFGKTKLKPWL